MSFGWIKYTAYPTSVQVNIIYVTSPANVASAYARNFAPSSWSSLRMMRWRIWATSLSVRVLSADLVGERICQALFPLADLIAAIDIEQGDIRHDLSRQPA